MVRSRLAATMLVVALPLLLLTPALAASGSWVTPGSDAWYAARISRSTAGSGGFTRWCDMPAAVADTHQFALAHHIPRNEDERRLWSKFHMAVVIHTTIMTAALLGLQRKLVSRRGR